MKSVDPPPIAYSLAAEAIGDLPAFATPEDMARAALDAAWATVTPQSRAVTREEIELVRELIGRGYMWAEIAQLMGCAVNRVEHVARSGNIRSRPGRRAEDEHVAGLEGLTEVVRKARDI